MKPIPLTEKHKKKLLKMCRKLFPEYKHIVFGDIDWLILTKIENRRGECVSVHWFEFCMTHLAQKIGNSPRTNQDKIYDESDLRATMCFDYEWMKSFHPVDFLYEQFKKITKGR